VRRTAVATALASSIVVAMLTGACGSGSDKASTSTATAPATTTTVDLKPPADLPGVQTFSNLTQNHVQGPVNYPQTPPVGGDHAPIWQNCGFYSTPIVTEQGVHSMEHGAVWITYAPDLPADQVAVLRNLAHSQTYVLVSPFPGLPSPVVASAWGAQLKLPSATDPELARFVKYYRNGPQTKEPGAPCSGASGSPE
jgi:hypothetical protein